jgi:hypothetical protein
MFHSGQILRASVLIGAFLGCAGARAELLSTSPFLPPQAQMVAAPAAPPNLEFKGISTMQNARVFLIFDASALKKKEVWLKLNEPGPISVKKYDPDTDTVTVDYHGHTLTLTMRTPKIASSGAAVPASMPVPLVMQPPTTTTGVKLASTPTVLAPAAAPTPAVAAPALPGEAERMQEWTNEIERRRNVRNAPSGAAAAPATPPPVATPAIGRSGQAAPANAGR